MQRAQQRPSSWRPSPDQPLQRCQSRAAPKAAWRQPAPVGSIAGPCAQRQRGISCPLPLPHAPSGPLLGRGGPSAILPCCPLLSTSAPSGLLPAEVGHALSGLLPTVALLRPLRPAARPGRPLAGASARAARWACARAGWAGHAQQSTAPAPSTAAPPPGAGSPALGRGAGAGARPVRTPGTGSERGHPQWQRMACAVAQPLYCVPPEGLCHHT